MFNRRQLLALGTATATGVAARLVFKGSPTAEAAPASPHANHLLPAVSEVGATTVTVTPFTEPMPVPPQLSPVSQAGGVDVYEIPIEPAQVQILPGLSTPAYTYGGSFVGPTIRARTNRPVRITYTNGLDSHTNVHLHGGRVPASSDGHPMDMIEPGGSRVYDYPNVQRGATLWYHDHTHDYEADHVYRGLHGFYLIEDPAERHLHLPKGRYDVPILLRNAQFDESGAFVFGNPDDRTTILANGKVQPYFQVAPRRYRFRLLNAALKHVFRLNLGGQPMVRIASDSGLLPAPTTHTELAVSSGERVEIVIDFAEHRGRGPVYLFDGDNPILRFDVGSTRVVDTSRVPDRLRELPPLGTPTVERTVEMKFDMSGRPPTAFIDGKVFDPNRVDIQVKRGTTEIWNIVNGDTDPYPFDHPFHLHLVHFQVLGRNGGPPAPEDTGLKDTVYVSPKGSVRFQVTFDAPFVGRYMYHCHYPEHSYLGMMAQLEVVP
ncbi:multicopper oxidase domain-containing protein [Micromonospora sp. WMMD712]|uniref:multicopper oxidase family protein n=1 Tax=Micromonospora sp. WMMD712 TaxID=3016096 RepID=UPI00249B7B86|nr:multicopper oxidase domain-containing protein [Micromonospora sp. WMMD712]WFE59668.1 multicopper oxidase domain-containing protein [Micromonospora sp. WMMD712]